MKYYYDYNKLFEGVKENRMKEKNVKVLFYVIKQNYPHKTVFKEKKLKGKTKNNI